MPEYPTNPALEAAVIANAEDDTPRLVYADWLDEHGDPDRAAYIRVQCRLAGLTPNDPDWYDLRDHDDELVTRLRHRALTLLPRMRDSFEMGLSSGASLFTDFQRGFPHFVTSQDQEPDWLEGGCDEIIAELTRLVKTSTIRGFSGGELTQEPLQKFLAAPVLAQLTALGLSYWESDLDQYLRMLGESPRLRQIEALYLGHQEFPAGELANLKSLGSVRWFSLPHLAGTDRDLKRFIQAPWLRGVQHISSYLLPLNAEPLLVGLGNLPELHTLDLPSVPHLAVPTLVRAKFPALSRLTWNVPPAVDYGYPRYPKLKTTQLRELLQAKWFDQLRALNLGSHEFGDTGLRAITQHPVAKSLRVLKITNMPFGKSGLAALAMPGAFPALTTLSLESSWIKHKVGPQELATFLSGLQIPNLRHLDLSGWPLGNAGAKALSKNPTFASLRHLELYGCEIADMGARAIFDSPHLQNLVFLSLHSNQIKTGADSFTNPAVMPRLGACRLDNNRIPQKTAAKFSREGLLVSA